MGSILVLRVFNYLVTYTLAVRNSFMGANQVFGAVAGEHTFAQGDRKRLARTQILVLAKFGGLLHHNLL